MKLTAKMAEALHHAHQSGLIHRDVKQGNILIDRMGEPYLADFGIAKVLHEKGLTREGNPVGTPAYMAPEQVIGKGEIGALADVYGLGATPYHCLCLRPPFQGETPKRILDQVRYREPFSPRKIHPRLNRDLETICLTAMEKDPPHRYQSALELKDDMERLLALKPIRARPLGSLARLSRAVRRKPTKSTA